MKNIFLVIYYGLLGSLALVMVIRFLSSPMMTTPAKPASTKSDSAQVVRDSVSTDTTNWSLKTPDWKRVDSIKIDTTKKSSVNPLKRILADSLKVDTTKKSTPVVKKISRLDKFRTSSIDTLGNVEITERPVYIIKQRLCRECDACNTCYNSKRHYHYNTKVLHYKIIRVIPDSYRTELCHKLDLLNVDYTTKYDKIELKSNDYVFKLMPVDSVNKARISPWVDKDRDRGDHIICNGEYIALCKITRRNI